MIIGYKKGFLFELVSLLYTAASVAISWFIAPILASSYPIIVLSNVNEEAELLSKLINIDAITNTIIYFVLIFLILKAIYIVIAFILKGMNKIPVIGKFNKILGGLFGIVNATIVTIMLSMLLNLPIFENGNEIKNNTLFIYVDEYSKLALNYVIDNVDLSSVKYRVDNFDINNAREDFRSWLHINNE